MDVAELQGAWKSTYHYSGKSLSHEVTLEKVSDEQVNLKGEADDGSALALKLEHEPKLNTLTGTWMLKIVEKNKADGKVFYGGVQFILEDDANGAEGKWVGFDNKAEKIKTGKWELKKK